MKFYMVQKGREFNDHYNTFNRARNIYKQLGKWYTDQIFLCEIFKDHIYVV